MHGYVVMVYLNDAPVVAAFLAFQRPRVVPEIPSSPIAVEMLAQLADGLPSVVAVFEAVVIFPLMKLAAFATESPKIGRDILKEEPGHLPYHYIRRGYSDRVGK